MTENKPRTVIKTPLTIEEVTLGYVTEKQRSRKIVGHFTSRDMGYVTDCWIWVGKLDSRGLPVVNTNPSKYSPRAMIMRTTTGQTFGCVEDNCGQRTCIRPSHLRMIPHAKLYERAIAARGKRR
jgi:hypothetical protein